MSVHSAMYISHITLQYCSYLYIVFRWVYRNTVGVHLIFRSVDCNHEQYNLYNIHLTVAHCNSIQMYVVYLNDVMCVFFQCTHG